jgi:hypothetical protein
VSNARLSALLAIQFALCALPSAAAAQQASIQGIVTSSSTGGPLEGVAVVLESGARQAHGTRTDRNGFYQIGGITPGTYTLRAQHLGQVEHQQAITFAPGARLTVNFALEPDVVALEGVVVSPERGATVQDMGRQRITPAELHLVPVPAGSGDLASYLQTLPGVTTTGDRGGQLFVRGGTPAENLVVVDGIPIYQPFHILGFFSAFPEDLVSSVDFYAGGFGARYSGRTSSVLDVALRDGDPNRYHATGSVSPFLAEALVEGPGGAGFSWLASVRRSLIDETSEALLGARQPLTFDSELFKLTATDGENLRCSALALRTSDRGQTDPGRADSYISWENRVAGGRCVTQFEHVLRLLEVNFSASSFDNSAVSRGSSKLGSRVWRMQHDAHTTSLIRSIPVYAGYHAYVEAMDYDLTELFGFQADDNDLLGLDGYVEVAVPVGARLEVRPGAVLTASPRTGVEPRLRASWEPFGRSSEKLQGAFGLYRQDLVGTSDMRDVSSVFMAWMTPPEDVPLEALHADLGWQQSLPGGVRWSVEGYYKRMKNIPVTAWQATTKFTTRLDRADGKVYGADTRIEYTSPHFYGFVGYGYASTEYETAQPEFSTWFGDSVQTYHPPQDRRHQLNALASVDLAGFRTSARWQFGTGLPFTSPIGFDEAFDVTSALPDVSNAVGTTRMLLDKPFTGRLPMMHRLDVSVERGFDLPFGRLTAQVGAINAYDRRNMFYYDLYTARRVDQLPLAPYASLTVRSR